MIAEWFALFGAGVASIISPCAFALVPAYVGVIAGELGQQHSRRSLVLPTLLFVAGFTTVFTGLGAAAGLVGTALPTTRRALALGGGLVIMTMGLAKLGLRIPALVGERRLIAAIPKATGNVRPYAVGVAFGAGWSPCVGPLLGSALTLAAQTRHTGQAVLFLGAYCLGAGTAFVAASLGIIASPRLTRTLRAVAPRLERVAGFGLLVLGALLVTDSYVHVTSLFTRYAPTTRGL